MTRTHGFRISIVDVCILTAAGIASWFGRNLGQHILPIPIIIGHFFLFCNVFRIRRSFELIWTGIFIGNVSLWYGFNALNWLLILAVQIPFTLLFLFLEIKSPRYHGIFSFYFNPHIQTYLNEKFFPKK